MQLFTSKGVAFQIDDDDEFVVSRYSWSIGSNGYPMAHVGKGPHLRTIYLHQFLLGKAPTGLEWDHENRDPLDNRRSNLRAVTHAFNSRNRSLNQNSTSGVRGVYWAKREGKWRARIGRGAGRHVHLGQFAEKAEAIAARRAAEESLWQ